MSYTVRTVIGNGVCDISRYRTFADALDSATRAIAGIDSYAGMHKTVPNPELVHIANSEWEALAKSPPVYSVTEARWLQLKVLRERAGGPRGTIRGMSPEQ